MRQKYCVYVLDLQGGRRYVGFSANVSKRIQDHIEGRGAQVTREVKVVDVHSIQVYNTQKAALQGERDEYVRQCALIGRDRVRGAYFTERFSLAKVAKTKKKKATGTLPKRSTAERYWVYVLELERGRRYIGFTKRNVGRRMQRQIDGAGARALEGNKVVDILSVQEVRGRQAAVDAKRREYLSQCSILGSDRVTGGRTYRA